MATWEPVDIDHDDMGEEYDMWNDDVIKNLEVRFNKLREFNETLNESTDEDTIEMTEKNKNVLKRGTIELVAYQIYDKLTILLNSSRKRLGIQKGEPIVDPIRNYDNFKLADDGEITYVYKRTVIYLGNINERLKAPWEIRKIGVKKLKLMGFMNVMDEDVQPYKPKYKVAREKVRKLDENLHEGRTVAPENSKPYEAVSRILIVNN